MTEYNRVQLPIYSLGSPAIHMRQHEVSDAIAGLESTERPNSTNAFDQRSVIRCKELRADKNSGVVKTTRLLVTNANFSQPITGGVDSYSVDLRSINYDQNTAALTVRSGGAAITGACRVSGGLSSSIAINDVPDFSLENAENRKRVRMYVPCCDLPYAQALVEVEITIANSSTPNGLDGERLLSNREIPKALQSLCQDQNDQIGHVYTFFVQGLGHAGRGYVVRNINTRHLFDLYATAIGRYSILIIGYRSDVAASVATRGLNPDPALNNMYEEGNPENPIP